MYEKIKKFFTGTFSWLKKNFSWVVAGLVFIGGFFVGRRSNGNTADFDKLRANNAELRKEIDSFRADYERLINLNRLNEQQLDSLAGQLEIAESLVGQSAEHDTGNAEDIDKLSETNEKLGEWIRKYGEGLKDL